ncbi:MAG: hypothetical protein Q9168_001364 [Polycauliona sp. 1 TL-2023]
MLSIFELSNELIDRIIKATHPSDLQSLALSNKTIHSLATKVLQRHLRLRKKYSTLRFGDFYENGYEPNRQLNDTNDPLLFLSTILEEPCITYYPTMMYLDGGQINQVGSITVDEINDKTSFIDKHSDALRQMVNSCSFIPFEDKTNIVSAICRKYSIADVINLLMATLPNLRNLNTEDIREYSGDGQKFGKFMWEIAEANQNPASVCHGKALTCLEAFSMAHTDTEFGEDIEDFAPFAMLPSMRVLSGTSIAGEFFNWPLSLQTLWSNVSEIDFTNSAVSGCAFDALLSRITALRKFTYNHGGAVIGYANYSPCAYVQMLRNYAASSLETLSIDSYGIDDDSGGADGLLYVGSLKMFSALEVIRLEDTSFQKDEGAMSGDDEPLEVGFHKDKKHDYQLEKTAAQASEDEGNDIDFREPDDTERSMDRLVDVLPASVKTLTLLTTTRNTDMEELFHGLAKEKADKLPNLREIIVHGTEVPLDDGSRAKLRDAGLKVMDSLPA